MSNATAEYYLKLNSNSRTSIVESTAAPERFGQAQASIEELVAWTKLRVFGPENVAMSSALNEAVTGLYLVAGGAYRPALTALRLFLELSLASIFFSANRLELAEWVAGNKDIFWSQLVDYDNGVLSTRYTKAFFPELSIEIGSFNAKARETYRGLSEYVHGNKATLATTEESLRYSADLMTMWFDHFHSATETVLIALSVRFLKELDDDSISTIAAATRDRIGYIAPIREYIEQNRGR